MDVKIRKEFLLKLKIVLFIMMLVSSLATFAQPDIRSVELLRQNPSYEAFFNASPPPAHIQTSRAAGRAKEMSPKGAFDRQAVGDTPIINNQGIVNVFSTVWQNRLVAGEFVSIYGANFANISASAPPGNLPTNLNNVQVRVNGILAPLSYVGPGQINAQMPYTVSQFGNSNIVVTVGQKSSNSFTITNSVVAPVLYKLGGVVYTQDQFNQPVGMPGFPALITGSQPVATVHYVSGLGLTSPFVDAGQVTPAASTCNATMVVQSTTATGLYVSYCGLSPGSIGLGQINLIWPANTPTGNHSVQLRQGGVDIPTFYVNVVRQ